MMKVQFLGVVCPHCEQDIRYGEDFTNITMRHSGVLELEIVAAEHEEYACNKTKKTLKDFFLFPELSIRGWAPLFFKDGVEIPTTSCEHATRAEQWVVGGDGYIWSDGGRVFYDGYPDSDILVNPLQDVFECVAKHLEAYGDRASELRVHPVIAEGIREQSNG